jgi:hypothetical protein
VQRSGGKNAWEQEPIPILQAKQKPADIQRLLQNFSFATATSL